MMVGLQSMSPCLVRVFHSSSVCSVLTQSAILLCQVSLFNPSCIEDIAAQSTKNHHCIEDTTTSPP